MSDVAQHALHVAGSIVDEPKSARAAVRGGRMSFSVPRAVSFEAVYKRKIQAIENLVPVDQRLAIASSSDLPACGVIGRGLDQIEFGAFRRCHCAGSRPGKLRFGA